jgi:hypothetical protein
MLRNYTISLLFFLSVTAFSPVVAGSNTILLKSGTIETLNDFNLHVNEAAALMKFITGFITG